MSQSWAPLFLLARAVDAADRDRLWGALVTNEYNPKINYSTKHATKNPRDLVADLKPDVNEVHDLDQVANSASHADFKGKLLSMIEAFWHSGSHGEHTNRSTAAEYWYMNTPDANFKALFEDADYRKDAIPFVKESIAQNKQIFFITAMCTLADAEHTRGSGKEMSVGGGLKGTDPHTGTEVAALDGEAGTKKDTTTAGTYVGTKIMAIGYHRVTYHKLRGARARLKQFFGQLGHDLVLIPMDQGNDYQAGLEGQMAVGDNQFPGLGGRQPTASPAAATGNNAPNATEASTGGGGRRLPPIVSSYKPANPPAEEAGS